MQMDFIPGCDFTDPRPVLPKGVAQCEGFGRPSWITKCVTLTNESGVDVARGICHSVKADLVIDSDDTPLGNDCIAVQIAESLLEDEVLSEWIFSMRAWHIHRVFLNKASLYDYDQRYIYNVAIQALNRRPRGVFNNMNLAVRGTTVPILQRRCLSCRRSRSILCPASVAARRIASNCSLVQRFTLLDRNSSMKADSTSKATAFSMYTSRSTTTPMGTK
jgi:hypothetical protein